MPMHLQSGPPGDGWCYARLTACNTIKANDLPHNQMAISTSPIAPSRASGQGVFLPLHGRSWPFHGRAGNLLDAAGGQPRRKMRRLHSGIDHCSEPAHAEARRHLADIRGGLRAVIIPVRTGIGDPLSRYCGSRSYIPRESGLLQAGRLFGSLGPTTDTNENISLFITVQALCFLDQSRSLRLEGGVTSTKRVGQDRTIDQTHWTGAKTGNHPCSC